MRAHNDVYVRMRALIHPPARTPQNWGRASFSTLYYTLYTKRGMAENEQQLSTATNTTTEEGSSNDRPVQAAAENSPNVSPKRKPHRARDNGGVSADTKHIKKKWRSKLMNSLRKKVKRGSKVASSGSFDAEATDFSFHPQTRGSPSVGGKKRGSPSSKRGSQGSLSIEVR